MSDKSKETKKIVPNISILYGNPKTGIHIYTDKETGHLCGDATCNDIREILPVLDAALAELMGLRDDLQMTADEFNAMDRRIAAEKEAKEAEARAKLN